MRFDTVSGQGFLARFLRISSAVCWWRKRHERREFLETGVHDEGKFASPRKRIKFIRASRVSYSRLEGDEGVHEGEMAT